MRFAISLVLVAIAMAPSDHRNHVESLRDAERAFARLSLERSIRDAFYESFAPDGIIFAPHPANAKELYGPRPANRDRTLDWWPEYTDVSRAGDMGFSTGPSIFTDKTEKKLPPRYGYFFSVWKKQPSGDWKVALDLGIQTPPWPKQPDRAKWTGASPSKHAGKVASSADDLKRFEHDFAAAMKQNPATAYESFLADRGWLFRDGSFPLRSRGNIRKHLAQTPTSSISSWEVLYSDVATSGDLGYTYGKYAAGAKHGYFVHVWKRDQSGKWKLLADILSKLPPEQAK